MTVHIPQLGKLDARRRKLGMTIDVVAKRSGISRSTVERVLSGQYGGASFDAVQAIADALGEFILIEHAIDADEMLEKQAEAKAKEMVSIVQGNAALEGQGVSEGTYRSMIRQIVHRLLAGSRRNIWAS